ncbi:hypothetical protein OROGR_028581 [Orobanche gracilis]
MFFRRRFRSLPLVFGSIVIGVVSGKAIFGPPLDEYWKKKKLEEEEEGTPTAKEMNTTPSQSQLQRDAALERPLDLIES